MRALLAGYATLIDENGGSLSAGQQQYESQFSSTAGQLPHQGRPSASGLISEARVRKE